MILSQKQVSIVLGTYNRLSFLKAVIESVRAEIKLSGFNSEIIIVEGGSTDGTLKWLAKQKDLIVIIQHNRGLWKGKPVVRRSWGYFMNLALKCAQGKYVCMLSDDCLVIPGGIRSGIELFERRLAAKQDIGAIAFYWRNWPEQEKYSVGLTLGNKMFVNHGLYLKSALEAVGYIDEESFTFYHADGDLCLKFWQRGLECIASPDSYIEHYSHANNALRTTNLEQQKKDWSSYLKKWEGIFYNRDINDIGSWIEKSFNDDARTADIFKQVDRISWYSKKLLQTVKLK